MDSGSRKYHTFVLGKAKAGLQPSPYASPCHQGAFVGIMCMVLVWQEGRERGWESATVKQRKTGVGDCYLEAREGSHLPRGYSSQ
jgi:hypothetical protein